MSKYSKLQSAINRLLASDLQYFFEQFLYGNREILLQYILSTEQNFPTNTFLKAGLSHGWAPDEQLWRLRHRNLSHAPRYVWNSRNELPHLKNSGSTAIGASWIYLLDLLNIQPGMRVRNRFSNPSKSNLLMLTHNTVISNKRLDAQALFYREKLDPFKTTVCLFWLDFCNPKVYSSFRDIGFDVVCAGYPATFDVDYQSHIGRPEFLVNVARIMSMHDTLITDECTTSTFYAASLGLDIILLPDPIALDFQTNWEGQYGGDGHEYFDSGFAWLSKFFPSLIEGTYSSLDLNNFAWAELGWDKKLSPHQLSQLPWAKSRLIQNQPMEALESAITLLRTELISERISL